ncbi:MAG: molybdenum cofactor guanylyltransferase, partial [Desulfomonilaceae bacterium]
LEPLHAVYSARCIPFIEKLMQRGNLKIKKLFNEVDMLEIEQQELATIDPCLQFHINVNTPTDLDKAMEMVRTNSQLS